MITSNETPETVETADIVQLHDRAAYIYNRRIWLLGAVMALAAVPFVITDSHGTTMGAICVLVALALSACWCALPKLRTEVQLDRLVSAVAILIYFAVAMGAYRLPTDVAPFAISTIGLSISFASTRYFVGSMAIGLTMWLTAVSFSGTWPTAIGFQHSTFLAPATALLVRQAINMAYDRINGLRNEEQLHARNLEEAYERLKTEESMRREYEEQLAHMQKVEGLGSLATGIAHDFNNYLMAITSLSENIGNVTDNKLVAKDADEIHRVAINASQVCTQILTFAGNVKDEKVPFRLRRLFEDINHLLLAVIPKEVRLRIGKCDNDLIVCGDRLQLQQVLLNFVKNAADARRSDARGTIEISVFPLTLNAGDSTNGKFQGGVILDSGDYVQISIRDNGKGILRTDIPRIFDPYFSTKRTGHGLGLAVSLGIIRRHDGVVRCESKPGVYTQFDIILPLEDAESNSGLVHDESALMAEKTKRNVLLVDDEGFVLTAVSRLMANIGWTVSTAANGQEAFEQLATEQSFESILLDYSMPGENGLELLQRIRHAGHTMPVVICSGLLLDDDDLADIEFRPDGILKKPYSLTAVNELLSNLTQSEPTSRISK